jgi:DNA-directed RNA polymerase sigma subunit (sigma70/sigma32)
VFEAAKGFDEKKNVKFSTWLGNQVRYHCLNTLSKQGKYYSPDKEEFTDHLADSIANEKEYDKILIQERLEYVTNILGQLKDKKIETIIRMRYLGGGKKKESFSVIAKHLKMSTQGVINLHDDFIAFLREKTRAEENMDKI